MGATRPNAEGATVQDLRQPFAENPQAAVTFATTEHFNLQTERAATIGEANGRASIFLGSVSAGLIALGFAAQGSSNSGATMRAFALVLFPMLVFLGLSTQQVPPVAHPEDLAARRRMPCRSPASATRSEPNSPSGRRRAPGDRSGGWVAVDCRCPDPGAAGASPDSPQDLDEEHPRIQHRDHQAEDDPGNEPVQPTTGTKQQ